mmetsp:Transcript_11110/g.21451  ORF Transcript_11110/g.21451 Transcript_11110/m.21451 type:complete len:452 (-) Transcript_11110:851-2206(-)
MKLPAVFTLCFSLFLRQAISLSVEATAKKIQNVLTNDVGLQMKILQVRVYERCEMIFLAHEDANTLTSWPEVKSAIQEGCTEGLQRLGGLVSKVSLENDCAFITDTATRLEALHNETYSEPLDEQPLHQILCEEAKESYGEHPEVAEYLAYGKNETSNLPGGGELFLKEELHRGLQQLPAEQIRMIEKKAGLTVEERTAFRSYLRSAEASDVTCFPVGTVVEVEGRGKVPIEDLQYGDCVKTVGVEKKNQFVPSCSRFVYFGHFDTETIVEYTLLRTAARSMRLSGDHVVFVTDRERKTVRSLFARDVNEARDWLIVEGGEAEAVVEISQTFAVGMVQPLTESGTLFADGILASSYAVISPNHWLMHYLYRPLVIWKGLSKSVMGVEGAERFEAWLEKIIYPNRFVSDKLDRFTDAFMQVFHSKGWQNTPMGTQIVLRPFVPSVLNTMLTA